MERDRFSSQVEAAAAQLTSANQAARQRQAEEQARAQERAAQLRIARERMRQHCRDAAAYLLSQGIPTEVATSTVPLDGYYFKGHSSPPTKFKQVTFPEGWVISRNTAGTATAVLTKEGKWMELYFSDNAIAKKGDLKEYPFERCDQFGVDERGPYLVSGGYDPYGEYFVSGPPPKREDDFTRQIASIIVAHKPGAAPAS